MNNSPNRQLSFFTRIKVLFGGAQVQIGAALFWITASIALGLIATFGWGLNFGGEWVPTKALYQGMDDSSMEINEEPIYPYYFSYSVDGRSYEGYSYDYYQDYTEGQELDIEYRSNHPERSRILGMSETPTDYIMTYVMVGMAFIGLLFLLFGLKANQKYLYLLRHGRMAQGRYLRSRATNTEINDETVYEYEFEFTVDERPYIATCKTHLHDRVEDEETETILYDPRDPSYNVVSDAVSNIKPQQRRGLGRLSRSSVPQAGVGALIYLFLPVGGVLLAYAVWIINS